MIIILQILCSFLFATGLLFTLIDLRAKYDPSFRYFGLSLILLSSMAAIDLRGTPSATNIEEKLYWARVLHVLVCFFFPFSLNSLIHITKWKKTWLLNGLIFLSAVSLPLIFTRQMLTVNHDKVMGGTLYYLIFFPFAFYYIAAANYLIIRSLIYSQGQERKIMAMHLVGFLVLCFFGVLDMTVVLNPAALLIPNYKIIGILVFGIVAAQIFTERFLMLLKDRTNTFSKLEEAYKDLEQANALRQLGQSTAMINHEIKNYMFMISGNAQLLQAMENLSHKGEELVSNIVSSVERLSHFSEDILEMSKTQIIKEKHPVNIYSLITNTISKHLYKYEKYFQMEKSSEDIFFHGDWEKLEHVFLNLFKNSIEASLPSNISIRIKIEAAESILLVSIEDDGVGCDEKQMENIFEAFYTTKKDTGGSGLGLSITRSIIENHGGKISAYSKNLGKQGERGLRMMITIPIFEKELQSWNEKYPIVVIKDGMENLPSLIRVFQNVRVTPYLFQHSEEMDKHKFPPEKITVFLSTSAAAKQFAAISDYKKVILVSNHKKNLYVLDNKPDAIPEIFSEQFILEYLAKEHNAPKAAMPKQVTRKKILRASAATQKR